MINLSDNFTDYRLINFITVDEDNQATGEFVYTRIFVSDYLQSLITNTGVIFAGMYTAYNGDGNTNTGRTMAISLYVLNNHQFKIRMVINSLGIYKIYGIK